jgi:hypothetical protein
LSKKKAVFDILVKYRRIALFPRTFMIKSRFANCGFKEYSHLCSSMHSEKITRIFLMGTVILFLFPLLLPAQEDMSWWNDKHNWDGITPWFRMMTTSSAYMGPNALPVPELMEGRPGTAYEFEFRPEAHLSKGDQTYNIYTRIELPIGDRASFESFIVPVEYYKMDSITRDERLARNYNAEGIAGGDFWFGTNVQVLRQGTHRRPDVQMSFYFKTASGTNLSDARYTDAPAYYILVNAGQMLYTSASENKNGTFYIRAFGNIGTYIWQTHSDVHNQDDAITYGLGISMQDEYKYIRLVWAGYWGYIDNGDRPMVLRLQLGTRDLFKADTGKSKLFWSLRYEAGLKDFEYHTIGFGLTYSL